MSDTSSLVTANDLNEISKRFKCNICNRGFVSRYNLQRHNETFHADDSETSSSDMEEDSETEDTSESMSEEEISEEESSEEQSSEDEDIDDDEDENHITRVMHNLLKSAYLINQEEMDEWIGKSLEGKMPNEKELRQAFRCCDKAKKTFRRLFVDTIAAMNEQRRHPLHKSIMEKAKKLISKGFSEKEAITSAVNYRKHGIDNLIKFP